MCTPDVERVLLRLFLLILIVVIAGPTPLGADQPKAGRVILEVKGYLMPAAQVTVSPKVRGQVIELLIDEGKMVKAGEILARLDPEEYKAALRLASARLRVAEAGVAKAKEGAGKADLAIAEAKLEVALAEVAIAQSRLNHTAIVAPVAGTVLVRRADLGTTMDPKSNLASSSILCEMADLRTMEVELSIPERDLPKVAQGQACLIRLEAIPNTTYRGQVARLMPSSDRARGALAIRVRMDVPEKDMRLRPELSAIVQILAKE